MRRYSIDELPQLFNVLAGDMSLVGPRPEILAHRQIISKYSIPLYMVRHQVRPPASPAGHRSTACAAIPIRARVIKIELHENWSMLFDIKILLMTPFKGVVNHQESLK